MPGLLKSSRLLCACAFLVAASPVLADTPATAPAPVAAAPPEPEQYIPDGRYPQYVAAAQAYLHNSPDSPAAPRVAMDLLVAATVAQDQAAALKMGKTLLLQYPTSGQARYLVGGMTDVSQFSGLINELADENFETMPPGFAVRFDLALRLGVARFGAAALGDGPGLSREAVIARLAGDADVQKAIVSLLNDPSRRGTQWGAMLVLAADDSKPLLDRVKSLHALPDRPSAMSFERYLLNQMSDADRQKPEVAKIQADDLLQAGKLADALPLLAKLTPDTGANEPRIQFWRALATAANGDTAGAAKILGQLSQASPNDPWGKQAAELQPALNALTNSIDQNVEAALAVSRAFKRGTDVLEGNAQFTRSDGKKLDLYVGLNSPKLLEILLRDGSEPLMGYRATDQDGSIYFKGDKNISHFTKPALLPVPQFSMDRSGNDFLARVGMKFSYSFDDLQTALTNLLATDFLSTRDGLQDYLHSYAQRGIVPLPPRPSADGGTTYVWVSPAVSEPGMERVSFTVGADGTVTAVQAKQFSVTHVRYGAAGTFVPTAPALPQLPPTELGQMNTRVLQIVLNAFASEFAPPPPAPATQPAAKK